MSRNKQLCRYGEEISAKYSGKKKVVLGLFDRYRNGRVRRGEKSGKENY